MREQVEKTPTLGDCDYLLQRWPSFVQSVQLVPPTRKHLILPRIIQQMSQYFSLRTLLRRRRRAAIQLQ